MKNLQSVSLATWLGLGSVAIVCVAVIAVAFRSVGLLEDLADEEGLSRAQLAAASAHEYLERTHDSVAASARLLATLPGLQRLVQQDDPAKLQQYLRNYCEATSAVDGCAVIDGATYLGTSNPAMPWDAALAAYDQEGRKFMLPADGDRPLMIGASSRIRQVSETLRTVTLKRLDQHVLEGMQEQVGALVSIRAATADEPAGAGDWSALHARALAERRPVSSRLDAPGAVYAASMPMPAAGPGTAAFIDVGLEARSSDAIVGVLAARLAATTLAIIGIAGLAGVLYGIWLARPMSALGRAARRIGAGDFDTAIPPSGVREVVALGANMDDMRRSLVTVTAELRRREAEAHAVLGGIVEGVISVDMDRRIRYANPQVARMLMRDPAALIGRFCGDVLDPEPVNGQRPCTRDCPILTARAGDLQGVASERVRKPDGSIRSMVIVSAAPEHGQQVLVLRDETEIETVRRARDSVLANVTHEFRTPLAAQMASVELLHDRFDTMSDEERQRVIRNLQRGGLRLMQLIDNLLESVRIDAGQLSIRERPVALGEVLAQTEELMKPLLDQRGQRLEVHFPDGLPEVVGDEARLTQVFVNLLANSIKFSPAASVIRIGAGFSGEAVTAWVEDEGPGIPDGDRSAIFSAFQRSINEEPRAPGLGIGLWVVRSIVERHHGSVDVERTADGRTRFRIRLPAVAAA